MSKDAAILRDVLARECDTVNHYESLAAKAEDRSVRELMLHLALEEKEHIAECARLLAHLDADYAEMLKKPLSHALGDHAPDQDSTIDLGSSTEQVATPEAGAPPQRLTFTIGSLIRR